MCDTTTNGLGLTDKNHACTCDTAGTHEHAAATAHSGMVDAGDGVIREHYDVDGMTCGHCVSSVAEELSAVDGVDEVGVNLNAAGTSQVMVVSSKPIPVENIRAAITEAGYELVTT